MASVETLAGFESILRQSVSTPEEARGMTGL